MYDLLKGIRIVEDASFIAAPLCGLTFVQLGADVIRFDPVGGGPDFGRWPLAPNGSSFYWKGLNKGSKRHTARISTSELIAQIRRLKLFIYGLRDVYSSSVFNDAASVSFLKAEIYQAALFQRNIRFGA